MSCDRNIHLPIIDTSKTREALQNVSDQIDAITAKARNALGIEYRKVNMDPLFDGGGFFCKRDRAALAALLKVQSDAFYAGFKRSDQPPPSDAKIEAAFQEWLHRN
jgi:hypothetical protein